MDTPAPRFTQRRWRADAAAWLVDGTPALVAVGGRRHGSLSVRRFAEMAGVDDWTMGRIIGNQVQPRIDTVDRILITTQRLKGVSRQEAEERLWVPAEEIAA